MQWAKGNAQWARENAHGVRDFTSMRQMSGATERDREERGSSQQ
jgi:hypothetical protein